MNQKLFALYALKWNPFSTELPIEALFVPPKVKHFCWRIENSLIREGGFALINGDPGTGKSVSLRLLVDRLQALPDISVGVITHPSSKLSDFYREMGDLFALELKPNNRWGGFKSLRERWLTHLQTTLSRPVLLIDEAQEMLPCVLNELRLLSSMQFDSQIILTVIFAGDSRFIRKLRLEELQPLGSRLRVRLSLEQASHDELFHCLAHLNRTAGNGQLMTEALMHTLCDHALGNYRALTIMANELLNEASIKEIKQLDEAFFLEVFGNSASPPQP